MNGVVVRRGSIFVPESGEKWRAVDKKAKERERESRFLQLLSLPPPPPPTPSCFSFSIFFTPYAH